MDIGCRQADMTPVYAALAGPTGRIALDASQADVASMESGIILKSGTLNMEIGSRSVNMPVAVSGNCVCVVRRTDNGQCCGAYTSETGGTLKLDKFASYEFVCYAVDRLASDAGILVGEGVLAVEPFRISIR